jgi:NADH-quinone oxidoreductase subunit L
MVAGIAIMRIYTRIFLGPNHRWERVQARRSA